MCMCIYIYIYRERCVYVYVYVYTYITALFLRRAKNGSSVGGPPVGRNPATVPLHGLLATVTSGHFQPL